MSTLAVLIPIAGVLLFVMTFGPVRHSWSRRFKRWSGFFHHPDEINPPTPESAPKVRDRTTLVDEVEPAGWNYSIYDRPDPPDD
jgi:hypothetical protein